MESPSLLTAEPPVRRTATNDDLAAAIREHQGLIRRECDSVARMFPMADPHDLYGACLDAMAVAWPGYDAERGSVASYLIPCLRRAMLRVGKRAFKLKDRGRGVQADTDGGTDRVVDTGGVVDLAVDPGPVRDTGWSILKPLLSRLPTEDRIIVQLRWFSGPEYGRELLDWEAIGRELGICTDSAQKRHDAAMRNLRLWAAESDVRPDGDEFD